MPDNTDQCFIGDLKLEIDELALEAKLTVTPDPEGAEWTRAKILQLLKKKGITTNINDRALVELLSPGRTDTQEPRSVPIAMGSAPVAGIPPRLHMEKTSIPEELQKELKRFQTPERQPQLYRREVKKTKIEEVITIKSKLPFLPDKEEKRSRWKREVIKKPALVSSQELGWGYAKTGDLLATVSPGTKAKTGLNIYGEELLPPAGSEDGIFLSDGLKEYGGEIHAETAGFFRHGPNWIELFPFSSHQYSVSLDEGEPVCRLDFTPGSPGAETPDPQGILKRCQELGADQDSLLAPQEVAAFIEEAIAQNSPLRSRSLHRSEDAEIQLLVSPDKMTALLSLKKGKADGKPLTLSIVGEAIRQRQFKGLDTVRVKRDLIAFYKGPDRLLKDYPLMNGKPPQPGEDGSIKWLVKFVDPETLQAYKEQVEQRSQALQALKSLEAFPIARIETLALVEAGTKVAEIQPPTGGEVGYDVFGALLPTTAGKEPQLVLYENVKRIKNEIVTTCAGVLEKSGQEDKILLRAHPHRNRKIEVEISEDRMKAFLTLSPAVGTGAPLHAEEVQEEIQKQKIVKGFNQQVLDKLIQQAQAGEPVNMALFARGKPTQHGKYLALDFKILQATGRSVTVNEVGRADFKTQDKITLVPGDFLLAELPPPTRGQDGWDIFGKDLPAKEGQPPPLQVGKNVDRREEEDGSVKFFSKITGELYYDGRLLDVLNIHTVDGDVSLKTGNIKFSGSVRVKGSVQSGFHVLAGGSITVDETVQGALLSAEENITAQKGVKGGGKAILRAKREIRSYFAEQAVLLSVGNMLLKNASFRCRLKCNGKLSMMADKGHIIGGQVYAKQGLEARNLGSEGGIRTEIHFGQDYLVGDQIEIEQKRLQEVRDKIKEMDRTLRRLDRTINPDRAALEALRKDKLYHLKLAERHNHRLFNLRERFEQHFDSAVAVKGTIFPGVVLESHGRILEITTKASNCVFTFNRDSGKIEQKPLKA